MNKLLINQINQQKTKLAPRHFSAIALLCLMLLINSLLACASGTFDQFTAKYSISGTWLATVGHDYSLKQIAPTTNELPASHKTNLSLIVLQLNQNKLVIDGQGALVADGQMQRGAISGEIVGRMLLLTLTFPSGTTIKITGEIDEQQTRFGASWKNSELQLGKAIFERVAEHEPTPRLYSDIILVGTPELKRIRGQGQPVVFLHGIMNTANSWDGLLSALPPGWYQTHEAFTAQYDWREPIANNGAKLKELLANAGVTNPLIVAYSLGGLVARAYISQGGGFKRLITIASPHRGTPLALSPQLGEIFPMLKEQYDGILDLAPNSSFIKALNNNAAEKKHHQNYVVFAGQINLYWDKCTAVCFWGDCAEYPCLKWSEDYPLPLRISWALMDGDNDGVIPSTSALLQDATSKIMAQYDDHWQLKDSQTVPVVFNYIRDQL